MPTPTFWHWLCANSECALGCMGSCRILMISFLVKLYHLLLPSPIVTSSQVRVGTPLPLLLCSISGLGPEGLRQLLPLPPHSRKGCCHCCAAAVMPTALPLLPPPPPLLLLSCHLCHRAKATLPPPPPPLLPPRCPPRCCHLRHHVAIATTVLLLLLPPRVGRRGTFKLCLVTLTGLVP